MKVKRDDTEEARRYWQMAEENSKIVASWPEWKRGARPHCDTCTCTGQQGWPGDLSDEDLKDSEVEDVDPQPCEADCTLCVVDAAIDAHYDQCGACQGADFAHTWSGGWCQEFNRLVNLREAAEREYIAKLHPCRKP